MRGNWDVTFKSGNQNKIKQNIIIGKKFPINSYSLTGHDATWFHTQPVVWRWRAAWLCVTSQKGTACNSRLDYFTNGLFEFCRYVNKFTKGMFHWENLDAFISGNQKPGALEIPGKILSWKLYLCLPVKCGKWRPLSAQLADLQAKRILNFLVWITGADLSKLTSCSPDFFVYFCKSMW